MARKTLQPGLNASLPSSMFPQTFVHLKYICWSIMVIKYYRLISVRMNVQSRLGTLNNLCRLSIATTNMLRTRKLLLEAYRCMTRRNLFCLAAQDLENTYPHGLIPSTYVHLKWCSLIIQSDIYHWENESAVMFPPSPFPQACLNRKIWGFASLMKWSDMSHYLLS